MSINKKTIVLSFCLAFASIGASECTSNQDTEGKNMALDFTGHEGSTGNFPSVLAKSNTGVGTGDGFAINGEYLNDWLGFEQAVLQAANMTPSGTNEAAGAVGSIAGSQIIRALKNIISPPGSIVGWPTDIIPTFLAAAEGQVELITDYPDLAANVLTTSNDGTESMFYRTTVGGTPSASGTYIKFPDLRGFFLRGRDADGTIDPDGDTRTWNASQNHAMEDHIHQGLYLTTDQTGNAVGITDDSLEGTGAGVHDVREAGTDDVVYTGEVCTSIGAHVSDETRPRNRMVVWCVVI